MENAIIQDLAIQSVETLRRAAERSIRGLRMLSHDDEGGRNRREAWREFLADSQADLTSLRQLRKTADDLLREGMEAESFLRFCEAALEAAEITMKGSSQAENAQADLLASDPEKGTVLVAQLKYTSDETRAIYSYFRRMTDWLQIPPEPLPPSVLAQLAALPPVEPRRAGS